MYSFWISSLFFYGIFESLMEKSDRFIPAVWVWIDCLADDLVGMRTQRPIL